ncbi:hypothetical protein G5I_09577 [Acromyrmex echinatior]|uniref:Uncharacterized protein n=1 Tax=Acromyrmex echinatior TaxID=103372 RepID=F4WUK5_ACREC|nr:hypothetical protein G5I_09577 [Acromyrmex echinatior]
MEHIAPTMKPYILKDIPTAQKMTSFPRPKMGKTTVCALPYPQLHVDAHKSATRYAVSHKRLGLNVLDRTYGSIVRAAMCSAWTSLVDFCEAVMRKKEWTEWERQALKRQRALLALSGI